jgi:hypothetical protein
MSEYFSKVQDDELNKSDKEVIETYSREDVYKELQRVKSRVKNRKHTMTDNEKERYFNAIRDLYNKLEES